MYRIPPLKRTNSSFKEKNICQSSGISIYFLLAMSNCNDNGAQNEEGDKINYKSISCEQIPELFLDKLIAKQHFGKFGKISRFILRPNRLSCTVEYENEECAESAYENAGCFNGHDFYVHYSVPDVGHVQNTEEWVDPDVQAELEAMGNSSLRSSMRFSPLSAKFQQPQRAVNPTTTTLNQKPTKLITESMTANPKLDTSLRLELETILRKPAFSDEEKYRVLDARDKLIRLRTIRQTDITKAVSTKGTCPDMCPEKERYMREFQRQVSTFEMDSESRNTMNHRIAIKEYSRSSADQEVPLAHELRPENVLKLTMLYMMHRIMGICDDPDIAIGDWFHFVWDRTRSIRKDITQQELCSLGAVELVEQCARFHIHCAARLIAEDPAVFDQKINTENLTKCLQTLKYMYHDLRIKNVHCPREAEFRSYIVLLNLNDANFLWEIKQLPEKIQNSFEIRTAINFYKAMESNNYVKFFDIVRYTSYMNACILLRYFTQVRLQALRTILKAYNWRKNAVTLPLVYLMNILGFESEQCAINFFTYYGLNCDEERVVLDKVAFFVPDVPIPMERAMLFVEEKRTTNVGDCICGEPLKPASLFENHEPHSSFDANDCLKLDSWAAGDQIIEETGGKTKIQEHKSSTIQSDNVFKVPIASPVISPKQHLRSLMNSTKLENVGNIAQASLKTQPAKSIFAMGCQNASKTFGSPQTLFSNSKFDNKFILPSKNSADSGKSIFSMPNNSFSCSTVQKNSDASTSLPCNPIFRANQAPSQISSLTGGNIFSGAAPMSFTSKTSANIFGSVDTNIFQIKAAQPTELHQRDNIFKFFDTKFNMPEENIQKTELVSLSTNNGNKTKFFKLESEIEPFEECTTNKGNTDSKVEAEERKLTVTEELDEQMITAEEEENVKREEISDKSERILQELLYDVQREEIKREAEKEILIYALKRRALELHTEMLNDFVKDLVTDELILLKYLRIWHNRVRKKIQQREIMSNTPVWVTTDTRQQKTTQLAHPQQEANMQMMRRYRLGQPCDFKSLLWFSNTPQQQPQVDMFAIISAHLNTKPISNGLLRQRKYFKFVISLPGDMEESPGLNYIISKWMDQNIYRPTSNKCPSTAFICATQLNVSLLVRRITNVIPLNERREKITSECDNSNAIIFIMSCDNILNSRKRLHHILKLSSINCKIPIAFIVCNSSAIKDAEISAGLELQSFIDDDNISSYTILRTSEYVNNCNLQTAFIKSLIFVARQSTIDDHNANTLVMQNLHSFMETALGDELWLRFSESWSINPSFYKICFTPKFVILLYNETVDRLIDMLDEDYADRRELPEELRHFVPKKTFDIPLGLEYFPADWKNPDRVNKTIAFLCKLKMANVETQYPRQIGELQQWILRYAKKCIPQNDELAGRAGYNSIKVLLESLNCPDGQQLSLSDRLNQISWLPIIKPIAQNLLSSVWLSEYCTLPKEIIYPQGIFEEFQKMPWWLNCETVRAVKMLPGQEHDKSIASNNDVSYESCDDLETILATGENASQLAEKKLQLLHKTSSSIHNCTSNSNLTRELDLTLYNFEVDKKCRNFQLYQDNFPCEYTQDEDIDEDFFAGAVGGCHDSIGPPGKKYKANHSSSGESNHEIDANAIIRRAFAIIDKVEKK